MYIHNIYMYIHQRQHCVLQLTHTRLYVCIYINTSTVFYKCAAPAKMTCAFVATRVPALRVSRPPTKPHTHTHEDSHSFTHAYTHHEQVYGTRRPDTRMQTHIHTNTHSLTHTHLHITRTGVSHLPTIHTHAHTYTHAHKDTHTLSLSHTHT